VVDNVWGKDEKTPEDIAKDAALIKHETNKAKMEAEREKALTEAEKARREREQLAPKLNSLEPEEHGELLKNLVVNFIKAGVPPERAHRLALSSLYPELSPKVESEEDTTSLTKTVVNQILKKTLEQLEKKGESPTQPPPPPRGNEQPPKSPVEYAKETLNTWRAIGEEYLRAIGIEPEKVTELREKPGGLNILESLGSNIDVQLKVAEFLDEQRKRWIEFEREMKRRDREEERRQREFEEKVLSQRAIRQAIEENLGPAIEAGRALIERHRGQSKGSQSGKGSRRRVQIPPADEWEVVCSECKHTNIVPAGTTSLKCESCGAELTISQTE